MNLQDDVTIPWSVEEIDDIACLERITKLRGIAEPAQSSTADHYRRLRSLCSDIGWYEFYNVLWIEWKDNIAYRKGLGRVFKEVWESQDLEQVDVILG